MELILGIITIVAFVFSLTIHELSHALVADKLGDPTARSMGRLSLNPLHHLDPLGTLMLILVHFGWAKPVPVDSYNLSHPRRDETLIALAGPGSNFIIAIILSIVLRFLPLNQLVISLFFTVISINVMLAVFNLLPIPPLDGSKLFLNLLPVDTALQWEHAFDRYGFFLLAALLFLPVGGSNIISLILSPIIQFILNILLPH